MIKIDKHVDLIKIIENEILDRKNQELQEELLKIKELLLKEDEID